MDGNRILSFLRALKENNTREWFQANKAEYEACRKDFEVFVNRLIPEIYKFDRSIGMVAPKECLFRIYRDTRFSPDKTPYKTNFGAFIADGGRKSIYSGYYLHLEDGNAMLAGGIYMPSPEVLKSLRQEIYFNTKEFRAVIEGDSFRKYFGEIDDFDKLKRPPRDFPADFRDIELLKYRSYTILHPVTNADVIKEDFFELALEVFGAMLPFNTFLNKALSR